MAKYGSDDLKIEVDNSAGSLVDLSQYVTEIDVMDVEALLEESHTFGDSWGENLFTGLKKANPVTLSGFYDDTATTGPDVILNSLGDTRTLKITWGGTKTSSVEAIITNYRRTPTRGEHTKFEAVLTPTGVVTEV